MLDGRRIEMSEETAKSIREATTVNTITQFPNKETKKCFINDQWALSIYHEVAGGDIGNGKVSGHSSNLFLANSKGTWYDENDKVVDGYFYYKPNK
jgi:hypothetical protein